AAVADRRVDAEQVVDARLDHEALQSEGIVVRGGHVVVGHRTQRVRAGARLAPRHPGGGRIAAELLDGGQVADGPADLEVADVVAELRIHPVARNGAVGDLDAYRLLRHVA